MQIKLANGQWVEATAIVDSTGNLVTLGGSGGSSDALTDLQLRATPIPVSLSSGNVTITGPITVSNEVEIKNDAGNAIPVIAKNVTSKFREAFEAYVPGVRWNETKGNGDIIVVDGNCAAASYLVISKNPLVADTNSNIESVSLFNLPTDISIGAHFSQRIFGQEFSIELVSTETPIDIPTDISIASISQTTTTLTVTTSVPHGCVPGMRIGIRGVVDSRLNYAATVIAAIISPTQFTVTSTPSGVLPSLTVGPFTSGFVYFRSSMSGAPNGTSIIFENNLITSASYYVRSESGDVLPSGVIAGNHSVVVGTAASVQSINSPYSYAFQPTNEIKLNAFVDGIQWSDVPIDSMATSTNRLKRTQVAPNISKDYKLRIRAVNSKSMTVPVAQIVSSVKTGTTTATVTTDVPHGLTISDSIVLYGNNNQTAFASTANAVAIASIINATQFTVVYGTAVTATTYGGFVARVNGGASSAAWGYIAAASNLVAVTSGILTITGSVAWVGLLIGDYVNTVGLRNIVDGSSFGLDGVWRVRNVSTTLLELEPIGTTEIPTTLAPTACGGGIIKRSDVRISYVRAMTFERQRVEVLPRPLGDISSSIPVTVNNAVTVAGTATVTQGAKGVVGAGWYVEPDNLLVADIASIAITASAASVTIIPTPVGGAAAFNISVTIVTGTTPTYDVVVQESDDTGLNWYDIYHFPRITATGTYRSPVLPLSGNRIRYNQIITGTTPSFTRAINRISHMMVSPAPLRQLYDRAIVPNTLNATSSALKTNGARNLQLVLNMGAITTTAPAIQLEGSDDNGASWYSIGAPLTGIASSTVQLTSVQFNAELIRARISTAGVGATLGYVLLKAFGI